MKPLLCGSDDVRDLIKRCFMGGRAADEGVPGIPNPLNIIQEIGWQLFFKTELIQKKKKTLARICVGLQSKQMALDEQNIIQK